MSLRRMYLLLFYCYFGFGILLQVFPPVLGDLQREFAVDHRAVSLVVSLFLAPMIVVAVPAGMAADRWGATAAIRAGLLGMLAGMAVSLLAPSWVVVLTGRVISGTGSGFLLVALLKVAAQQVSRDKLGLALGIFAAGLPAGTGIAFNLLRPLADVGSWRLALAGAGLIVLSSIIVFEKTVGRSLPRSQISVNPLLALRSGPLWRLAATAVLGYAAIFGFTTWAPTTLVGYAHIPPWAAALIASVLLVIDIPFAPLWGAVSDRMGRRKPFILAAFGIYLAGSLLVPGVAAGGATALLVVVVTIMGVGCSMFFPAALTIPAETVAAEQCGAAYGMLFTSQVAGILAGPLLLGQVLDSGTPRLAFIVVSVLTAGGLLAGFTLRSR